jgi:polar amino acid transport system substrate-binding protein
MATAVGSPPPYEYFDEDGKMQGFEPDLMREMGKRLGVDVKFEATAFSSLLTGLDAGRYDLLMNGMASSAERENLYDVLSYMTDSASVLGLDGTTGDIKEDTDLCGHSMATQTGTSYVEALEALRDKCEQEGLAELKLTPFDSFSAIQIGIKSGRVEYGYDVVSLLGYIEENTDGFEVAPYRSEPHHIGMVLAQGSPLVEPMKKVFDEVIADGTYAKIMAEWAIPETSWLTETVVNVETS